MRRNGVEGIDPERFTLSMFALVSGMGLEQLTDPELDGAAAAVQMFDLATAGLRAR